MKFWIAANLAAIVTVLAGLFRLAWPPAAAVRLRNALLAEAQSGAGLDWKPPRFPADFRAEQRPPTPEFARAVGNIGIQQVQDDWRRACAIATHLVEHARDRGPIQSNLLATYRGILGGRGYCADFAKVFLALAHAAGLLARQWSFSFDGFGGHGHVVLEVYDRSRGKWIFLDVYNNLHAVDPVNEEPLGALEFRDSLLGRRPAALLRANGAGRPGWTDEHKARDYYLRGAREWYLWMGNDVYSYDAHPVVALATRVSGPLGQVAATLFGAQPRIRIVETPENSAEVRHVLRLGRRARWLGMALAMLVLSLALQLTLAGRANGGG
jgi:hypothetical protein